LQVLECHSNMNDRMASSINLSLEDLAMKGCQP
jgi:hypothetical protein